MRRALYASAFAVAASAAVAFGCNAVLGIDAASIDPTLAADSGVDSPAPPQDGGVGFDAADITCDHYCTLIMQACTGELQEYISKDVCLQFCNVMEPGIPGEQQNNTLACRQYHANAALSNAQVHCHHAGPLGGGVCGNSQCTDFCLFDQALCNTVAYPNEQNCEDECNGVLDAGTAFQFVPDSGEITIEQGNSFNCRLYHLESAANPAVQGAAGIHCPHTAVVSDVCK